MKVPLFRAALFVALAAPAIAQAAVIPVTTNGDAGAGSLRQAITEANATAGQDEIVFDGVTGTIALQSELPTVTRSLTITGPGADVLTIDGGQHESIFKLNSASNDQTFAISGLTLTNGRGSDGAGAVYSAAGETTTISRCVITGNFGDGKGHGGAIASESGLLTVVDSAVTDNESVAGGGGIEIYGITSPKGVILNSTVSGNRALNNEDGFGGGIHCGDCELVIVNSTISGNEAAVSGGGILNSGVLALRNVTVTDNTADADGVPNPNNGIDDGGGILNNGTLTLRNTIVAGNTDAGGEAPDCDGTLTSEGYNLILDTAGCTIAGATEGNVTGEDPLLGDLSGNGGPTPTHALLAGSPALDAGDPSGCVDENGDPLATDQRGFERHVGGACDIGAFEAGACGDGIVDAAAGEACDDGNTSNSDACLDTCIASSCGDDFLQEGAEECDDGNTTNGDGCSSECASEDASGSGNGDSGGGCALIAVTTATDVVADDGLCSLREAVMAANGDAASGTATGECAAGAGADVIDLPAGTYALTLEGADEDAAATGDLDVTEDLTLDGAGAAVTVIDGNGTDRVFHLGPAGLSNFPVDVNAVTLRNGDPGGDNDGGAIHNRLGDLTLTDSVVRDNAAGATGDGGGIYDDAGITHCIRSTFSGNTGDYGGGLSHSRPADYVNCTLSGNHARVAGGGIYAAGNAPDVVTIKNSTIADNTSDSGGGGLHDEVVLGGTSSVQNSIIAGNSPFNCEGTTIASLGNNLEDANTCGFAAPGDLADTDPLLGALADNGGPTPNHALLAGSPAVDAGSNVACPTDDQRGVTRPLDGDGDGTATCDIGAYEATVCGDGDVHEPAEACDDGNAADGDGCSAGCEIEEGVGGDGNGDDGDAGGGCSLIR